MQHENSTGLKQERYQTWDCILAKFNMPALEKFYTISSKAKAVKLFLIFIVNRRRISRSWPKIENLPKYKNTSDSEYTIKNAQTYQVPLPPWWTLHPTYPNLRQCPHAGPLRLPCYNSFDLSSIYAVKYHLTTRICLYQLSFLISTIPGPLYHFPAFSDLPVI